MTTTTAVEIQSGHAGENEKFGNDASLTSVERLLAKVAGKCFRRVEAMGIGMAYSDVLQEMRMSYVKAKRSYNPQSGVLFSTYCQAACQFNFNHAIKKMERERAHLGLVSLEGFQMGEDGESDPMEVLSGAVGSDIDRPDARLDRAAELRENLASLSPSARKLVGLLLQDQRRDDHPETLGPVTLRSLAAVAGIKGDELKRVRLEILAKFGVKW